jgi:hypothetical protein
MKREDIVRMAREIGLEGPMKSGILVFMDDLERFAALVAAAEREACAQICDEHADDPVYCGQAIRARGKT